MQTFLPYPDYAKSAAALDTIRLNKQLVEVQQIIKAIRDPSYGWQNHPAVNMWRDNIFSLCVYGGLCYTEWKLRKSKSKPHLFIHKSGTFIVNMLNTLCDEQGDYLNVLQPSWIGREDFHRSHQSNLIRKDPEYYGPQFPGVPDNLEYVWPSKDLTH